ncbi:MAG: sarcosine oxidase subunit alpha family protein, partial [Hyphomicrobiaceae bacterium]
MKYHRPRGIMTAGPAEPSAMVTVGMGAGAVPNMKATEVALHDGLISTSQNAWPSAAVDLGAVLSIGARLMPAGFYYKTFMATPAFWNTIAEPVIRRAAGFGKVPSGPDPDRYDHRHVHTDVLIIGAGPAGLMAALAAGLSGARVILADRGETLGGSLLPSSPRIGEQSALEWVDRTSKELAAMPEVPLLPRTTVIGLYDQGFALALERLPPRAGARERLWHIRAKQIVLATGVEERPLIFPDNDRPGVMLASAARVYLERHAVLAGRSPVIFTNGDQAYETAFAYARAGARPRAIVDLRPAVSERLSSEAETQGIQLLEGASIVAVRGGRRVRGVTVRQISLGGEGVSGRAIHVACDAIFVSGGVSPVLHLFAHAEGRLAWDEENACFRPAASLPGVTVAGGANAARLLEECLEQGAAAGMECARSAGFDAKAIAAPRVSEPATARAEPIMIAPGPRRFERAKGKLFVDIQNDTTAADIALAGREGFSSVEHMKRYTLTGFGTDQGKLGNVNAIAVLAAATGRAIGETGHTTFRPPYTPVSFGALAGYERGDLLDPIRVTAIHDWHAANGAVFEDVGQWKRPWYFSRSDEDMQAAVRRECLAVRENVGVLDASTLGKIDCTGPDAAAFLDRIYTNVMSSLPVGSVRYGLMCKEDGMVLDDGTVTRLAADRFIVTTTTGGAARILDWFEEYQQTEWPHMKVYFTSVTEQWATVAVAGPKARTLLERIASGIELDPKRFPFMTFREGSIAGIPARVFRISFSGELSYEVNVLWWHGEAVWKAVMEAGRDFGVTPYGTETMHVLRAEKGFIIVGQETDGTVTPFDLGLGGLVSKKKKDFIGLRSFAREDTRRSDRKQLVGLLPEDADFVVPEGAQIVARHVELNRVGQFSPPDDGGPIYREGALSPVAMLGHVTSSYFSPALGRSFALALMKGGRAKIGATVHLPLEARTISARVVEPVFYDKENKRRDG